ncbi:MAG: Type prenyl endopeptidase Rce1-like [Pseudonocardiales bacterium]|nr:Type prenyl endopeptidase Rce1-like [Pseudonocardiales bacterium]
MNGGFPPPRAMTAPLTARTTILLLAFACAVCLRSVLSGARGSASMSAGLVFAGCLTALGVAAGLPAPRRPMISVLSGTLGAAVLTVPALLRADPASLAQRPIAGFAPWIAVAATVAVTEEAFLRGTLFGLITQLHGEAAAVLVSAIAFAGLHVPLYGWHVVPLDIAVGMLLAMLRILTGNWCAAAVAHVLADAAGWWL